MTTTPKTTVRARSNPAAAPAKAPQQIFRIAHGHLGLAQSKQTIQALLKGRAVTVPDAPVLQHRYMKPGPDARPVLCDAKDDGAYPVTVLVI